MSECPCAWQMILVVPEIQHLEVHLGDLQMRVVVVFGGIKRDRKHTDSPLFPMSLTPVSEPGQSCKGMPYFYWKDMELHTQRVCKNDRPMIHQMGMLNITIHHSNLQLL